MFIFCYDKNRRAMNVLVGFSDYMFRRIKDERLWWRLAAQWRRGRRFASEMRGQKLEAKTQGGKALIIPCDPWSVVGSRGDQAMILACIQRIRASHPGRVIDVMTDSHATDAECRALGLNPVADWNVPLDVWFPAHAAEYAEVYILGADVTDGVYGWPTAMKMLAYYDLFFRMGTEVHYLGFSWSRNPNLMMRRVLSQLSANLPLLVRDPVSYQRLKNFTTHRPLVQVADVAFCLKHRESTRVIEHRTWVEAQHAIGKTVIAINVHTMFNDEETKSVDWERVFAAVLKKVQETHVDIRFLFLPHDNRPRVSDHAILKRLYAEFDITRTYLVDEVMDADEIKFLLGSCDGLIAGRMHISIAALGQGVPVLGLVYQGKFEGLWQHFNLSEDTLMEPRVFMTDPSRAEESICAFIDNLQGLRMQIARSIPKVLELSKKNFQDLRSNL